ncbi:PilN domain-containing protein [Geobacter grbiciae]|uniref:PilN domain-containing protein n=1 Tax=Geobacter grbiciae TaxID=155042 RepID=UPI001C0373BC|nr:PilN domain-containing protein [Geobacter grbiciae]MBT1074508.1 PilN domain-containing protein [Geobacter grbiciae]
MDLKINLSTRYFIDTRKLNAALAAAVALLVLVLFFVVKGVATNAGQAKQLEGELAKLQERFATSAKGVTEQEYQGIIKKISVANGILKKRGLNWLLLLDQLEAVVPDGVTLSSIEPKLKEGTLTLAGTAKEFRNLRTFVENLEGAPRFSDVFLQSQTEVKEGTDQRGVGFTVTCKVDFL